MSYPQMTPVRPVPGAFLNTPAASRFAGDNETARRRLFAETETAQGSSTSGGSGPLVGASNIAPATIASATTSAGLVSTTSSQTTQQNLPPVARAAQAVNQFLQADESYPELDSYCRRASSEYDFNTLDAAWAPFHKTQMYPIPNQVFSHYNTGQLQTLMGLFAEINHAWVVIDNSLFLWDYTHPDPELIGFEDQPHTIHAVALVAPKPGIFVKTITHILVVATSSEMILLGLSAEPTPSGTKTVSLYSTKLNLPLRGTDVRVIAGTADGRIFFGGSNDTDVHELYYQQEEKWFSNRCGKINHTNPGWSSVVTLQSSFWANKAPEGLQSIVIDDSRKLVYTLSTRSTIRTYHMDGPNKLTKVIEKERNACLRDITHMISASPLINERMTIVSISAIPAREASKLHLMALTNTGCRLFLSATSSASYMIGGLSSNTPPQSMQVQFIKFPPSDKPARSHAISTNDTVDTGSRSLELSRLGARFAPGYFLDFVVKDSDPNIDLLFVSAPETGRIKAHHSSSTLRYYEHGNWIDIGSRAEDVGLVTKPFSAAKQPIGFGNELAVQFDEPATEFAVLTNTGVHIIRRRRLVDTFAAAIRGAVGDEGLDLETRKFISRYGRVETISCALAVACGHGGDARPGATRAIDQTTEDRARAVFVDYGGQPSITETDGTPLNTTSVRLSPRHDALCVYITRLIRTLWKNNVVALSASPAGGFAIASQVPLGKLLSIQEQLERLRRFLDANKSFIQGLSGPSDLQRVASKQEEVALQAEHQALYALQKLMESISEGISFVLMLFDERVSDIFTRLDAAAQQELKTLTYESLFSQAPGKDLAKLLVKSIVNRNIESGSNVETVADALRRRCGSFCSPDDVVIFKAQEQLKRASEQPLNSNQSRTLLHESLRLFERVAGALSFPNLQNAVSQYIDLKYYAGAIQLCLIVAREKDRGNTALSWVHDGKPANDPRENAFSERRKCYELIYSALQHLDDASSREPETIDGRLTLIGTKRLEAYTVVNDSDDEVFHFDLYEWYIQQGWTDRILAIDSPHVITYLQSLARTNVEHADLLCRFYTQRERYFEAAQVQHELANSDFALGIKDRIILLSKAKANASVATAGVSRQQQQVLAHEVGELLDIANIQDDLLERLKADSRIPPERTAEIEEALDGQVISLTDLFNQYADQANYYDLCLLIYHSADYRNPSTITQTWVSLIEQIHEEAVERMEEAGPGIPVLPSPYESVSVKVQNIAHRTSLDSFIFPVPVLLPEICRYAVEYHQDAEIGADPTWPVQLFLSLGVSHDSVTRVLESVFDTQDYGFSGNNRNRIVELIVFAVDTWQREVKRRGSSLKGDGAIGAWVKDLLSRCEASLPPVGHGSNPGGMDLADVRRRLRSVRREVDGLVERGPSGSMRFM
ncbi:Nucleoporin NUP170 [Colletotrichum chlorophyti]|uniref:Nucleoporin NUP170 n=1 Tax=Colletotrichum chlorophyti TaxID=708187 RepID=A0A1Q8S7I5_9PEZI|nr:Nucleoporin NUP170 [Colletotrichum chlorophyti]